MLLHRDELQELQMALLKVKLQSPWTSATEWPVIRVEGSSVELGGDAGVDHYVTFETRPKAFSQVSESQEFRTET